MMMRLKETARIGLTSMLLSAALLVASGFASLRAFFDQLAHYQRIVSITNFELKQMDKQSLTKTVEARFDLTAYYVSSERLQNQVPAPNNKPAAGGAVPAPVAPAPQPAK